MNVDLTTIRGDTFTFTLTLVDENGDPFDLTDVAMWFTVGDEFGKTVGDGIVVSSPLTGVAEFTIEPDDTADWSDIRCVEQYAIRLELADASIRTPVRGRFIVLPVPEPVT